MIAYVEESLLGSDKITPFLDYDLIPIKHYKDVFNRRGQRNGLQKESGTIILSKNEGNHIYKGSRVCQSFGEEYFYYTSLVKNCPFDCEYCYLQGMYDSGYTVIFLNIEDTFKETESLLKKHPVYLSVSYDTDLLALESRLSYVKKWEDFAREQKDLLIEIRTKTARSDHFLNRTPVKNVIYAFTLSPEEIIKRYEHKTPPLKSRLKAVKTAIDCGFTLRLSFDPVIYERDFYLVYGRFIEEVKKEIDLRAVRDVSIGAFRMPKKYLKEAKRKRKESMILNYPFKTINGISCYPKNIEDNIVNFLKEKLSPDLLDDRIFLVNRDTATEIENH